jgi:hypothetical protein
MAKEAMTEAQRARRKAIRMKARAKAEEAGKVWKELPREERRGFIRAVREAARAGKEAS